MEQSVVNILSNYVPMVQRYQSQFSSLNTLLRKTTLTGKISSLDIAENLFDYMEKTQEKFENLQNELMHTIMQQNFYNAQEEARISTKVIGDMLGQFIRGCHESVLGLSKNRLLHDLVVRYVNEIDKEKSIEYFEEIVKFFKNFGDDSENSFKDILFFANDGTLLRRLNFSSQQEIHSKTKLSSILDCTKVESYAEYCQKVDFYCVREDVLDEKMELFLMLPLRTHKEAEASVAVVFMVAMEEELNKIMAQFPYRLPQGNLLVVNDKQNIVFSDNTRAFPIGQFLAFNRRQEYTFLDTRSKTYLVAESQVSGLEHLESAILQYTVCRIVPLHIAFDVKQQTKREIPSHLLEDSLLVTENLDRVIAEGENINEELGDVVINGEIIASKSHSYALNPILNNIRILSEEMNTLCIQSTEELQKGIYHALFNVAEYYAKYLVLATDRLFAKAIKDVEQIGTNVELAKYFNHQEGVTEATIKTFLSGLVEDFAYFYNVLLVDKEGMILLNALEDAELNQKKINFYATAGGGAVVSNFEPTILYADKPTFLISLPIKDANYLLGGLVFVLDFAKMQAFLNQVLPSESSIVSKESEIFSVVFDDYKNILSTTKPDFSFDVFLQNETLDFKSLKKMNQIAKIGQKFYLVCSDVCNVQSVFTEYTRKSLYAVIFVAVKEDSLD